MRSSVSRSLLAVALSTLTLLAACSGGGSTPAAVGQSILPCDDGLPSFDVWQANFRPDGRTNLVLSVDTIGPQYASEFRMTLACQGVELFATVQGAACTFPPPSNTPGVTPQCPFASMALGSLENLARVGCLIEVVPTQPLGIGVGACADPSRGDYKLSVTLDDQALSLVQVAHNCRTAESCLQANFGIDVSSVGS